MREGMRTPRFISPYSLMQEQFRDEPWKLLVGCIMLNQTSAVQARPAWTKLFEIFPDPASLLRNCSEDPSNFRDLLLEILRPLGFQNRRLERIYRMTLDFQTKRPDLNHEIDVTDLYGIGKYAADSFNMFCRSYIVQDVKDKELRNYVEWAKTLLGGADPGVRPDPQASVPEIQGRQEEKGEPETGSPRSLGLREDSRGLSEHDKEAERPGSTPEEI